MQKTTTEDFMGRNGLYWWTGVVEDRNDPMMLGRVRVRILGLHSELRIPDDVSGQGIKVSDLPWAMPMQPITSAAMNGIGSTPLGPVEGTWVVGFSRDGEACQDLIVMGTLGGIPQAGPLNEGFNDPNLKYPKTDHIGEPDTNRLARNESISQTVVQTKKDGVDAGVAAGDDSTWDEPETPYAAEYPYNHVYESESGHIQEVDDTPGAERLHEYHKSGTFKEVHPDGTVVEKIVKDQYTVVLGDGFIHVSGNCHVKVDGDSTLMVDGKMSNKITGAVKIDITGQVDIKAAAAINIQANSAYVKCPNVLLEGAVTTKGPVVLDQGKGQIVTTMHICAFTGNNHPHGSTTCFAKL